MNKMKIPGSLMFDVVKIDEYKEYQLLTPYQARLFWVAADGKAEIFLRFIDQATAVGMKWYNVSKYLQDLIDEDDRSS